MPFQEDLAFGKKYENVIREIYEYEDIWFPEGKHKEFDCWLTQGGNKLFFEVKADKITGRTGNICIEYESYGLPSGIMATTADYYVYFVVGENVFYEIPTDVLREFVNKKKYHWTCSGGDKKSNNKMFLFRRGLFEEYKNEYDNIVIN
jgi:hypothetical protein